HRRTRGIDISHAGWGLTEKEICEWVSVAAPIGHRPSWVAPVDSKAIHCGVSHQIGAHLEIVFAENPGKSVSKCHQVLVQGTICIPPAVLERRKSAAEIDGGVTERLQFRSAHDCSIGVDIRLIETDAGKKTLQGGVAVAAQFLEIETSTRFVYQVIVDDVRIGSRNRVIPTFILS